MASLLLPWDALNLRDLQPAARNLPRRGVFDGSADEQVAVVSLHVEGDGGDAPLHDVLSQLQPAVAGGLHDQHPTAGRKTREREAPVCVRDGACAERRLTPEQGRLHLQRGQRGAVAAAEELPFERHRSVRRVCRRAHVGGALSCRLQRDLDLLLLVDETHAPRDAHRYSEPLRVLGVHEQGRGVAIAGRRLERAADEAPRIVAERTRLLHQRALRVVGEVDELHRLHGAHAAVRFDVDLDDDVGFDLRIKRLGRVHRERLLDQLGRDDTLHNLRIGFGRRLRHDDAAAPQGADERESEERAACGDAHRLLREKVCSPLTRVVASTPSTIAGRKGRLGQTVWMWRRMAPAKSNASLVH